MDRGMWYRNSEIIFNIISCAKDREIALLSKVDKVMPVRNIMANYMSLLTKNFEAFHFYERTYNVYYSLARYKTLQLFNFHPTKRKIQRKEWNEKAIANTDSFDFGLDFDCDGIENIKKAWVDCKKVKELLDKYKVRYTLRFSGSKGFHITIPYHYLPPRQINDNVNDDEGLINWLKNIATLLHLKLDLPTLDLGIFDPRRIWKASYSWVCETNLICLPLTDEQFDHFELSMVQPLNVLKNGVRNRGDLLREGDSMGFRRLVESELETKF